MSEDRSSTRLPEQVGVVEVGPRDGFQMEERFIPTEKKVEIIDQLSRSGLQEIEAVSFVHPKVIPQMRDASEVMRQIERRQGVCYSALVPNFRGAERALESGVDFLQFVLCATEAYNQRNVGMSIAESLDSLSRIVALAAAAQVPVGATLAATFGCPFEGQISDDALLDLARRVEETGVAQLGLADSLGLGGPVLVRRIVRRIRRSLPRLPLKMHLHDTRNLGLANALVALEEGVETFDTAFGGLGGCPVVRGASGNVATEDFLYLCQESGVATGVDLDAVRLASRTTQTFLERDLPSRVLRAGTRAELEAHNRKSVA